MKRVRIKPSKPMSFFSMIAGLVMVGIGIFFAIPNFGAFGIFWTLLALAITGYHAFNALSAEGAASHEIEIDDAGSLSYEDETGGRLRRLERLREDGLISEGEYRLKRGEIIKRI